MIVGSIIRALSAKSFIFLESLIVHGEIYQIGLTYLSNIYWNFEGNTPNCKLIDTNI